MERGIEKWSLGFGSYEPWDCCIDLKGLGSRNRSQFDTPKESWFVAQYTRNVYAKCCCKEASEHRARGVLRKVMLDLSVD